MEDTHAARHDAPEPADPARPADKLQLSRFWLRRLFRARLAGSGEGYADRPAPSAPVQPSARQDTGTSPHRSRWEIVGVGALAALVLTIVGVGLFVGMGALQDAASAAHIDSDAADLYWIGVDGLIVVAIVAALILRNDPVARRYCLFVIGGFTAASGLLQYLHGLGWFTPDPASGKIEPLPWGVVLVVAFLVIGMIFCATHLFVHTLRRLFPGARDDQAEHHSGISRSDGGESEPTACQCAPEVMYQPTPPDPEEIARLIYTLGLDLDIKIGRDRLAKACGISSRTAGRIRTDVEVDREEAAAARDLEERAAAGQATPDEWAAHLQGQLVSANGSATASRTNPNGDHQS